MQDDKLSSLASVVYNIWYFIVHGHSLDMKLYCKTQGKIMRAREMFARAGEYVFARPETLPLDANVKAVCVNYGHPAGPRLYFETTLVDWDLVKQKMDEWPVYREKGLGVKGKQFTWNGQLAVATSSRQHFGNTTNPRTVFHSIQGLAAAPIEAFILVADLILENNCFSEFAVQRICPGEEQNPAVPITQEMRQHMSQQMMLAIKREQVPLQIFYMRQRAFVAHRSRVLRMSSAQLAQYIGISARRNPFIKIGQ